MRVLLVGLSTRALAESAVHGGFEIVTVDYFGDRDQKERVENHSLLRDFRLAYSAENLLEATNSLQFDAAVYIASLENHPDIVLALRERARLLGNGPDVLRQVRDWQCLGRVCREEGIRHPVTLYPGQEPKTATQSRWLVKPVRSGGGHGTRWWAGKRVKPGHVLQQYVAGRAASVSFVANGHSSNIIGISEQLIGLPQLGARGFAWCGNILPLSLSRQQGKDLLEELEIMTERLTRRFGLRGVNGVDLILAEDQSNGRLHPYLVEINPRYTASMELVERSYGLNIFSLHWNAMEGRLPGFSLADHLDGSFLGKAIVFARNSLTVPESPTGAARGWRDIPFAGDRIEAGRPVCSVFARADGRNACLDLLLAEAANVRTEFGDRREE